PPGAPDSVIDQNDVEQLKLAVKYRVDINQDGIVDAVDLAFMKVRLTLPFYQNADVDKSGEVTKADYDRILSDFIRMDVNRDGVVGAIDLKWLSDAIDLVSTQDL